MLTENDVVRHVAAAVEARGFEIKAALKTTERGIDIKAEHPREGLLLIEAKGATSSKRGTPRFGKPFSHAQAKTHLAMALFAMARIRGEYREEPRVRFAIALPKLEPHVKLAASVSGALRDLKIDLIWVSPQGNVRFPSKSWP